MSEWLNFIGVIAAVILTGFVLVAFASGLALAVKTGEWSRAAAWFCSSTLVFVVGIPVTLLGFPVVAVALLFRQEHDTPDTPFTDPRNPPGWHRMVTLPAWALLWDNKFDGAEGDRRGWWNAYCLRTYGKTAQAYYSMWQWLACRNPANYWSRVVTGVDVSQCTIRKIAGHDTVDELPGVRQWQFLVAEHDNGRRFYRLFCSLPWFFRPDRAVMIDIGWKMKLKHSRMSPDAPVADRIRGSVFTPSLWKALA